MNENIKIFLDGSLRRKNKNKDDIGISGMPNQNYIRKRYFRTLMSSFDD